MKRTMFGVDALVGGPAVVLVTGPVRPDRVALELVRPLAGDLEAHRVQLGGEFVGEPAAGVVGVDVDGLDARGLFAQFLEPVEDRARAQVGALVDVVRLVEPVPAVDLALDQAGAEVPGLRVRLGDVDVHGEVGVVARADGGEFVEVGQAAGPHVVVAAVVGVARVVALVGVALLQHPLAEVVGGQRDPLDVVEGLQERVGGLAGEVERDVLDDAFGHAVRAERAGHGVAVGDGAVLPGHLAVAVGVAGEHHRGLRQRVRGHARVGGALGRIGVVADATAPRGGRRRPRRRSATGGGCCRCRCRPGRRRRWRRSAGPRTAGSC